MIVLVFVSATIAGSTACEKKDAAPKEVCARQIEQLRAWIGRLAQAHRVEALRPDWEPMLPEPPGQPYRSNPSRGPWLEASAIRVRLGAESLPARDASLLDRLKEHHRRAQARHATAGQRNTILALQLVIHDEMPWAGVQEILSLARRAGFRKVALIYRVANDKYPLEPPASSLDKKLAATRRPPSQTAAVRWLEEIFKDCGPATAALSSLPAPNGSDPQTLSTHLLEIVEACACRLEIPALKSVLWHLYPPAEPALMLELADPSDPRAERLRLPPIVPWRVAFRKVQKIASRGVPLRLEAAPAAQPPMDGRRPAK